MPVLIGEVTTFANPEATKDQCVKISEECMEVFEALGQICGARNGGSAFCADLRNCRLSCGAFNHLVDECADVLTAVCNLLAALGVDDMRGAMMACEKRNRERGRL